MYSLNQMKCSVVVGSFLVLLAACASMKPKLDAERAKSVRKVAVVAFEIQQEKATDNLGLGKYKALKNGKDGDSKELQIMAGNVLNQFTALMQKKTGWQVLPIKEMTSNLAYKQLFHDKMTGIHLVSTASDQVESIYPEGLLNIAVCRSLTPEQRSNLAKALGVDAVIELSIVNSMKQSMYSFGHLTGDADFALTGRANVLVYSTGSEDPLWLQYVTGDTTKKSDTLPASLSKREKLSQLGELASISAIQKLMDTYTF